MNEDVPRKTLETTVLAMPGQSYWMIFDNKGRRRLQVRGAPWLDRDTLDSDFFKAVDDNGFVATNIRNSALQSLSQVSAALAA